MLKKSNKGFQASLCISYVNFYRISCSRAFHCSHLVLVTAQTIFRKSYYAISTAAAVAAAAAAA